MTEELADKGQSATLPERLVLSILRRRPTTATGLQKIGIAVGAIFEGRVPESFKAFHYGGFDDDVAEALESLHEEGYVEGAEGSRFMLTREGRDLVDHYLSDPQAKRLVGIAETVTEAFEGSSDDQVIAVVYDMFPELTIESRIKQKVARTPRPKNIKVISVAH
jgi:hypothetical protein